MNRKQVGRVAPRAPRTYKTPPKTKSHRAYMALPTSARSWSAASPRRFHSRPGAPDRPLRPNRPNAHTFKAPIKKTLHRENLSTCTLQLKLLRIHRSIPCFGAPQTGPAMLMEPNKVQLEIFEGPLDLLLYLVKKEEVDIYEVNLTKIATQFIEYIEVMRELDLDIAGEFLVMASTLMYIKSRELLPKDQQAQVDEEEEGDDPRWELIRQLVEYKKFKDAAAQLQTRELEQENIYARIPGRVDLEPETNVRPDVSVFDLINAVNTILKRFGERDKGRYVFADPWTVS